MDSDIQISNENRVLIPWYRPEVKRLKVSLDSKIIQASVTDFAPETDTSLA